MIITRIHTIEEYKLFKKNNEDTLRDIWLSEKALTPPIKKEFFYKGFSYPAKEVVDFMVDFEYSDGIHVNWRERLVCPKTNFSNRLRACIHFADFELGILPYHKLYITEQVTPLYRYFKEHIPTTVGSEFLGTNIPSGTVRDGIRHEDMTRHSFADKSFDFYLSFECFEHIPDFRQSFREAHRVLKDDGALFFTVPFVPGHYESIIRATISPGGEITHLLEPEYHGDPVNGSGILCFTHFGWQMLDDLRGVGFRDVYALIYWSDSFGYLGGEQIIFIAKK